MWLKFYVFQISCLFRVDETFFAIGHSRSFQQFFLTMASNGTQLGVFGAVGSGGFTGFAIGGGFQGQGPAQQGNRTAWIQSQLQ